MLPYLKKNDVYLFQVDYSPYGLAAGDVQFAGGPLTALMAHPPALAFVSKLFGGPPVMMDIDVAETRPVCYPYPPTLS